MDATLLSNSCSSKMTEIQMRSLWAKIGLTAIKIATEFYKTRAQLLEAWLALTSV